MADQPGPNPSIEELLEERHQIEVWLARLDSTSDTAPEAVRQRVRHDYERRMEAVTDELRAHATDIAEQLAECRIKQADLALREAEAQDTMSEAEIRHAVGEYGEDEWQRLRSETHRTLVSVREELHRVNTEINRLVEVQALIAGPPTPEPEPAAAPPPAPPTPPPAEAPKLEVTPPPAPDPFADEPPIEPLPLSPETPPAAASPPAPTGAPRFVPRNAKAKESPPRTIPIAPDTAEPTPAPRETLGDELAFLKSVSEDERTGPSPRRATGTFSRAGRDPISLPSLDPDAEQASPPSTPSPPPPPPAPSPPPPSGPPSRPVLTTADPMANTGPTKGIGDRPSQQGAAKTLKCADCGGLNRPTEWYCERCGAELAAL